MYYEEKIINGVLNSRISPDEDWRPMSATELTIILITLRTIMGMPGTSSII